jgi:CubicO group peptidase (beta-lactamase class C family)
MTTIAALQCVEKGLFTLDEDVSRILPEWKDPDIITGFDEGTGKPILVKAKNKITLRRMLSHQSGFGYDILDPLLMKLREMAGEEQKSLSASIVGLDGGSMEGGMSADGEPGGSVPVAVDFRARRGLDV